MKAVYISVALIVIAFLSVSLLSYGGGGITGYTTAEERNLPDIELTGNALIVENEYVAVKAADEPGFETHFVIVGKTAENLNIMFYHDSYKPQPVWVEGNADYHLSKNTAEPYENIALTVKLVNGEVPKFALHVGPTSEIYEFGGEPEQTIPPKENTDLTIKLIIAGLITLAIMMTIFALTYKKTQKPAKTEQFSFKSMSTAELKKYLERTRFK